MDGLLSLVIPVYNEVSSLEPLLGELDAAVAELGAISEVVFVDDGSTDGSFAEMERLASTRSDVRIVKLRRNFGKSAALAYGFAAVRGDVVVTLDGDRQDDPREIGKLLEGLDEGNDLVSGWKQGRQDPASKTLPSRFFNWTVRRTTGIPLHDFNCGFKAYRREVADSLIVYGELHRYIPVVAAQQGFRVAEVRVAHRRRTAGRSKFGWQRFARGYLDLLTVLFLGRYHSRPQHLFGGFGTLLFVAGLLVSIYLTIDKLAFGHALGDRPLLLLGVLFMIVGVQLVSLGFLSELIVNSRARSGPEPSWIERVVEPEEARADGERAALAAAPSMRAPK